MADFEALLKQIEASPNKGKVFERFIYWFLKAHPNWQVDLKNIWLWDDWPDKWGPDCGIDLVKEDRDGKLWAIQCKCYSGKRSVGKQDIDSFLSESSRKQISGRLLFCSTNNISPNALRTCKQQEKIVKIFDKTYFSHLEFNFPQNMTKFYLMDCMKVFDRRSYFTHERNALKGHSIYDDDIASRGNIHWLLSKQRSRIPITEDEERLCKLYEIYGPGEHSGIDRRRDLLTNSNAYVFEKGDLKFIIKHVSDFKELYWFYVPWDILVNQRYKRYGFTKRLADKNEAKLYEKLVLEK